MNDALPTIPLNLLFVLNDKELEGQIRHILISYKKSHPFHVSFVQSGNAALSVFKTNISFDIVFTQLNLPVMNGLSLIRHLEETYPAITTVLLSHKDDYNTIRAALNRGAFDFLVLPLDPGDFKKTLNNVLNEARILRESRFDQEKLLSLEQELDVARKIQTTVVANHNRETILEKRIEIGGHSQAAHQVGGDFYDYFFLDENRLGFVIGDVASKGLPAALFMATSRTLIRSLAFQGYPPDLCLEEVNKILVRESDPSLFIAVFYGILDLKTGEVNYSNGGHTYPYYIRSQDKIRLLNEPGGMVLGVLEEAEFVSQKLNMSVGDIIFLYTDGFISSISDKENSVFEKNIDSVLSNNNSQDFPKAISTLFDKLKYITSNDSEQDDDLTIFAIKYKGILSPSNH